jgi:hypothetical protein
MLTRLLARLLLLVLPRFWLRGRRMRAEACGGLLGVECAGVLFRRLLR